MGCVATARAQKQPLAPAHALTHAHPPRALTAARLAGGRGELVEREGGELLELDAALRGYRPPALCRCFATTSTSSTSTTTSSTVGGVAVARALLRRCHLVPVGVGVGVGVDVGLRTSPARCLGRSGAGELLELRRAQALGLGTAP